MIHFFNSFFVFKFELFTSDVASAGVGFVGKEVRVEAVDFLSRKNFDESEISLVNF